MPLAVYRELAAHLEQVEGIKTELISQNCSKFDYTQSQIGSLLIRYPDNWDIVRQQQVEAILNYYQEFWA